VVVVNSENIIITGGKEAILQDYKERRARGKIRKGPYYPRMPDRLFKRSVRGMLPYQEPKGRTAFKRLSVYIGVPEDISKAKVLKVENALDKGATRKMYLGDLAKLLGAKF